jgi:hypothetical protein
MRVSVELTPLHIARSVEWREHFRSKFTRLFEDGIHSIRVQFLVCGHLRKVFGDVQDFIQNKLHIAQRRLIGRHRYSWWIA